MTPHSEDLVAVNLRQETIEPREQVAEGFSAISDINLIVAQNICSSCSGVNGGIPEQLIERSNRFLENFEWKRATEKKARLRGGGGGIRTPETLSGLTVFKTAGFNHSPTPPLLSLTGKGWRFQMKWFAGKKSGSGANESPEPAEFSSKRIDENYLWMNLLLRLRSRHHRHYSDGCSDDLSRYHQLHAAICLSSIRCFVGCDRLCFAESL